MVGASLDSHLRRLTRNLTAPLPETDLLALGLDLARELARAHAETPARHPALDAAIVAMVDGRPRLEGGSRDGDPAEDLFSLGALLHALAHARKPEVAWRLDGPPSAPLSSVAKRAALAALAAPRREDRFPSAQAAAEALAALQGAESGAAAPWPLFRCDPRRSGVAPASVAAARLRLIWERPLGAVRAAPALGHNALYAATTSGDLHFLDPASGRMMHSVALAAGSESSPALEGNDLFVGSDNGDLAVVDTTTGALRARVKLGSMIRSAPVLSADRALVGVVDGKNGGLAAIAADTAKPLWRAKSGAIFSSPAILRDRVFIGSDDARLRAFDAASGRILWQLALDGKVRATPALSETLLVIGDFSGVVYAVQPDQGTVLWKTRLGAPVYSSAALMGDRWVVGCHDGHLRALAALDGATLFDVELGGPIIASPVVWNDRVLIATTDGDLCLLDATGRTLWRERVAPAGIQSSPIVASDRAYVGSERGLLAFGLEA
jgi:eukaryotic-like serine/threonine-protein kinase